MARIVAVETHGNPYALYDNATDMEYQPASKDEALQIFDALKADSTRRCAIARARGRYCLIDVGLAQIDEANFSLDQVGAMLDPCRNIRASAPIMLSAWRTAIMASSRPSIWQRYVRVYGAPGLDAQQVVLRAAYSIYNANSGLGNPAYVARIEQAGRDPYVAAATRFADEMIAAGKPRRVASRGD